VAGSEVWLGVGLAVYGSIGCLARASEGYCCPRRGPLAADRGYSRACGILEAASGRGAAW
jgi:hypothetical protein